ncbi:MAG: putative DNA binding domain-containing protein [Candidatus Aureabacteria bacterium]|nr:putative DNA binding domain-containing protein [Candidatus Auribacterota bacterium]
MLIEELRELINSLKDINSDTTHVEIKSAAEGFPKRIWETVSAFANTPGGGIIILGVRETERSIDIVGVKHPAKCQNLLAETCSQMIPPLRPLIQAHKLEKKMLVTAEIPEVSYKDKPCYYSGSGVMSGSLIRVADGDRRLTQYEVQGFLDGRGQPLYDIEPVAESSLDDFDPKLIHGFLKKVREKLPKINKWSERKILRTYRIITKCNGNEVPTLAGLLCLGAYPQRYFPGLTMHILVYPDKSYSAGDHHSIRLLDNIKVEGALVTMVPQAIAAIKRNLQKRTVVKGLFREDVLEYPEIFLREAIINALGHRDYAPLARGTAVQVGIFSDRIEIVNPGGLFGPVTEDRLGEYGLQATRNSHLMKLLEDIPVPGGNFVLCENRGTGIPAMINSLVKTGMELPQFSDLRNQFRIVCSNRALFDSETLTWLEKYATYDLSEPQRFSLAYLRHKGRLINSEYCRLNDCDSRVATRDLTALSEKGLIRQHGVGRWTYYTIQEASAMTHKEKPVKLRIDRREQIIAFIKRKKEVRRQEIAEALKISSPAVLYWLRKLIKDDLVRPTTTNTKDPHVKYRLKSK